MTNIRINGRLSVASYALVPLQSSMAVDRLRIDGPHGEIYGLTFSEGLSLARALIDLTVSGIARDIEQGDTNGVH
jgi:hypothetical protein